MKSVEAIRQIQSELKSKGVKYCLGAYVDIHGVPKGKVVPIDHLQHMAHGSELYTGYALDGLGQHGGQLLLSALGLVGGRGDGQPGDRD